MTTVLVTGGAGFIGANLVHHLLAHSPAPLIVVDKMTYAANPRTLDSWNGDRRVTFVQADIGDANAMAELFAAHRPGAIYNLAAETHVDRSIDSPEPFIRTNIVGTSVLLDVARRHWMTLETSERAAFRFLHISTDEVYGSLGASGLFSETTSYAPNSPYSASKAGADHLVRAYFHTYGLPTLVTNCSNNYGPFQHPEKLIPLFITNALQDQPLPLYGDGLQARDWLYVDDHADAISTVLDRGERGAVYNVAAGSERTNRAVTEAILRDVGRPWTLVRQVEDRLAHDRRYAMDGSRLRALGWQPQVSFDDGIARTVDWYRTHEDWWTSLRGDDWAAYYQDQYGRRLAHSVEA